MMIKYVFAALVLAGLTVRASADNTAVSVSIDAIRQRFPWNGKVDVDFTVRCTDAKKWVALDLSAVDATVSPARALPVLVFADTIRLVSSDGQNSVGYFELLDRDVRIANGRIATSGDGGVAVLGCAVGQLGGGRLITFDK